MKTRALALALFLGLVTWASSARACFTIWLHPQLAYPEGTHLSIALVGGSGPAINVTTNIVGDLQWVDIPVVIPANVQVNSVQLCYRLSSAMSFVSQIRLSQMTLPPTSSVTLDDPTDRTSTTGECVTSAAPFVGLYNPSGSTTLGLRLNFANTADVVTIGGVGINVTPSVVSAPATIGPSSTGLAQNYPNPFHPSTTIEYSTTAFGRVEVTIFDVAGQRVRALVDQDAPAGDHRAMWDSRDDRGRPVEAGVYFYQVKSGGRELGTRQMILLR